MTPSPAQKKSGFAALIGRSNVGKSTLLNALVGTKVAITSPKPQTTRQTIQGIVHDPRGQIVFIDTPGVFEKARDPLTKHMNAAARDALQGVDLVIYVVDPTREIGNEEHIVLRMLDGVTVPKILAINKTDLRNLPFIEEYRALAGGFDRVVEISSLRHLNLKPLVDAAIELLPKGEPFYPEYQFSNIEHRFWLSELIREKLFIQLQQELPYSTAVEIDEIEDRETNDGKKIRYIKARILTNGDQYKRMIIGAGGRKIKEIGWAARKELEQILDTRVFLELEVEVDPDWMLRMRA
ncbi:MAG: GTPase Era [Patescibacteria group bacterium]